MSSSRKWKLYNTAVFLQKFFFVNNLEATEEWEQITPLNILAIFRAAIHEKKNNWGVKKILPMRMFYDSFANKFNERTNSLDHFYLP